MENNGVKHKIDEDTSNKRQKTESVDAEIQMNEMYIESTFIKSLSESFRDKKPGSFDNNATVISEPFTCCVLPDFIQPISSVNQLKDEIDEIEVKSLLSDLYQYKQSDDLAKLNSTSINCIRKFFYKNCLDWMKQVTGIPLTDKVDISCSCYTYTDYLLCHDDELEGRRIAFIYYLVPEWKESDGGTLDLFNSVNGEPSEVCKSLLPTFNKFIFFEVSPSSFHQVAEVLGYKTRTSISGWFNGPPLDAFPRKKETILLNTPTLSAVDYREWINPTYLEEDTQLQIRESFEESSEIELMDFLLGEKYDALCEALNDTSINWKRKGPVIRRNYEETESIAELPTIVKECQTLFCSETFFVILNNMTGIRLHPMCEVNEEEEEEKDEVGVGKVSASFRRWQHGSYSLLSDQTFVDKPTLNASLHFNCKGWDVEYGGFTSYVSEGEKDELLRVEPKPNSLALVYITPNTGHFVKFINCRISKSSITCFHDIFAMYREEKG